MQPGWEAREARPKTKGTLWKVFAVVIFLVGAFWIANRPPKPVNPLSLAGWTVIDLGHATTGATSSLAAWGNEQVGVATYLTHTHACIWHGSEKLVDLNPLGSTDSEAMAVCEGKQGGFATIDGEQHAGTWSGGALTWLDLNPPYAGPSGIHGMDQEAQVGEAFIKKAHHAFLWRGSAAASVDLNPTGANKSEADAVSKGHQVGFANFGGSDHAGLWSGTAGSWIDLQPATAGESRATSVDGSREFGHASFDDAEHAGLWSGSAASWVDLNPVGASESSVNGAFSGYQAGWAAVNGRTRAMLWSGSAASRVDLNAFLPGTFVSSVAVAIWADAEFIYVVGTATHADSIRGDEAILWRCPRNKIPGG